MGKAGNTIIYTAHPPVGEQTTIKGKEVVERKTFARGHQGRGTNLINSHQRWKSKG